MLVVGVFLGSLDTASNSLVVYMLGPALAPPLTQSLHAMVALGFVLGSLLIRPFLPDTGHTGDTGDTGEVCRPYLDTANTSITTNTSLTLDTVMEAGQLPDLVTPFTIIFIIHAISAAAYLSLSKIRSFFPIIRFCYFFNESPCIASTIFQFAVASRCQLTRQSVKRMVMRTAAVQQAAQSNQTSTRTNLN